MIRVSEGRAKSLSYERMKGLGNIHSAVTQALLFSISEKRAAIPKEYDAAACLSSIYKKNGGRDDNEDIEKTRMCLLTKKTDYLRNMACIFFIFNLY